MKKRKNILLALQHYSVDIHAGVAEYANRAGWHLRVLMRAFPEELRDWDGDGVISGVFRRQGKPWDDNPFLKMPQPKLVIGKHIASESIAIGAMAAEHLCQRGDNTIAAYSGSNGGTAQCLEAFWETIDHARHGKACERIEIEAGDGIWAARKKSIQQRLMKLKKPAAVFALSDSRSCEILEAAQDAGLHVPEDVAILGTGNDTLICDTMPVPLSSVDIDNKRLGYEAAQNHLPELPAAHGPVDRRND